MKRILESLENIRPECDFKNSNSYIIDGLLDSLDIIALVSALDEEYEISIDGKDIVPENFNSLEAIKKLIKECGGKI